MIDGRDLGYIHEYGKDWLQEKQDARDHGEDVDFDFEGVQTGGLDDALEVIFAAMEIAKPCKDSRVPMSRFGAALPFLPAITECWSDHLRYFRDVHPRDTGPIDVTGMVPSEGSTVCITRVKTVPFTELHTVGIKMLSRHVVREDIGFLDLKTGRWDSDTVYGQLVDGKWLTQMTSREQWEKDRIHPEWKMRARPRYCVESMSTIVMAHSIAFTMRYEWTVSFSLCGSLSVKIPTTPKGAQIMFKDRDVETGRSRRSALKNWVRKHSRACASGKRAEIPAHLRGRTPFTWNGFDCLLEPSPFDLELCERNKREAAERRRAARIKGVG